MEEVGRLDVGQSTWSARGRRSWTERIGLVGVDGEQHGGRNKLVVDGHSVEREMHCWVKAERSQGKIARVQDAKSGRAEGRPEHSIDLVGEFQRRANQHREIPNDRNARPTDEALRRLGTCDTTKHVLTARGGDQRVTVTQVSMQ